MALIKKQLLAKEDMLLSADNTPVSQARAGTIISVHPVNASVIPFDETKSIVEAVEDLAYTHPSKHPVSIIDGSSNPSKFVKTDTLGNTGFDIVTWAEVAGKPNTYTPNSHEHSLDEVTSGTLPASRVAISETRQFITAEQASQLLDMEVKSNKGMPNGYAPLDSNGKINPSFLSALNLVEVFTPADLASMLALTSAQPGDIAYRQDNSTSYMLVALPASTEANWKSLNTGSQVISVNGQTGVVSLNTSNIAESTNLYFTNERVDDRVANLLQAGTNISLAYDGTSNTLTINANDTSVDWSEVQSKPTTISGYGITDAYTKTETNSALSLKAPLESPTFTGTVALPSTTSIGNVSSTELGYLDGVTSYIQTQFNGKVSKTGDESISGVKTFNSNTIFNGNVGIGTSSPAGRIDVSSADDTAMYFRNASANIRLRPYVTSYTTSQISALNSAGSAYGPLAIGGSYTVIETNGIERMRIDTSGNIGIGTSSPTTTLGKALHIYNNVNDGTPNSNVSLKLESANRNSAILLYGTTNSITMFTSAGVSAGGIAMDSNTGTTLLFGSNGFGYTTGSGGIVTQLTNKSTSVTLNKPSGQITLNNSALASNTATAFTFYNSTVTTLDQVVVSCNSGNYNVWTTPGSGGCGVLIKNNTAGSLSEAVIINFEVFKGATA